MPLDVWWLLPLALLGAALYTSVGHGGATVYLALLTLAGYSARTVGTTVLVLNVAAAGVAFVAFRQAGHLRPRIFLPFVAASVPMAYLGGLFPFSSEAQDLLLGGVLLLAAVRFLLVPAPPAPRVPREGAWLWVGAPVLGAALGFLAGATGIGGGIFLSPILLVLGWCDVKEAGAIASAFIVLNSLAGLAAKLQTTPLDLGLLLPMGAVVLVGAVAGSWAGAKRIPPRALQVLLGAVLLVAAAKALL